MKKIVYFVGGLLSPNGMGAILSQKINYLAEHTNYDLYMILTEKAGAPWFYDINPKVKWVNFDINFDELDVMPIYKKVLFYWLKQCKFRQMFTDYLMKVRPDITVSICRREINFINNIKDGSKKVAEIHFARPFYRRFEKPFFPKLINEWISNLWVGSLIKQLKRLDRFVVLTKEDSKNWPELTNLVVIPNFVFSNTSLKSDLSSKRVVAVGRYSWQKGFDMLIDAWKIVSARHPDWHLDIYGSGDNISYQKLADELCLSSSVTCHKSVDHVYEKYSESSIYVLSSRYEGFGLVLVEAMGTGLPVVSFACPCGPRDIIEDGVSGYLVEAGDVRKMAEKICYLIENRDVRESMGQAAIARAGMFSRDQVMHRWIELFESL
ncbi:Glycosyltransferase involved in cell wall bisynthesis [Xylanibacter ruminicola]|uniref:Glycosyltransferase involved in cell wall bisynthesis n=1 Tax=Xylanibacter ruminicola TaxID=839 RepID=A0A1H5UDI9_XYLRU|nr:glycosyltransferase family 4 protein [Xylanibacter ruminicola]SEF73183.1 Glycosyltransferase involved in cell wall bisynthesis [Xylanibacter ruminicola]